MSVLFYKRPTYIASEPGYLNSQSCQRYVERAAAAGSNSTIPRELSFDNVLQNKTLPPCALGDFMDYLMYVAKDAENLQFFLWFRDYVKRFDSLSENEKKLSPEWTGSTERIIEATNGEWPFIADLDRPSQSTHRPSTAGSKKLAQEYVTALPSVAEKEGLDEGADDYKIFVEKSIQAQKKRTSALESAKQANKDAGLEWSGFNIQPLRSEVTRIIAHYFAPSAPRQLNLSPAVTAQVLHALQHTTHPSAFQPAIELVTKHLQYNSHPNFIRWSICNGNRPRVFFVRTMGVLHTALGFVVAILLTLSKAARWWRIFAAPVWFIGICTLVAAYKGLCVILHASHQRAVKPWEDPAALYSTFTGGMPDDDGYGSTELDARTNGSTRYSPSGSSIDDEKRYSDHSHDGLDPFGNPNDTHVNGNGLVEAYNKKSSLRKVFDASVAVQESAIRVLQDRIARMSQIWGAILTIVFTVIFVALPKGNFY